MALDSLLAGEIWSTKYRFRPQDRAGGATVGATWDRVVAGLAEAERAKSRGRWRIRFREALEGYRFLPAAQAPSAYPRCGTPGLVRKEGCDSCLDCGYSRCG
jgi:hypothetical protein